MDSLRELDALPLWPKGAPLARGEAPADRPSLRPFLLPGGEPRACVVVCPGGGYGGLADHEGAPVARWLCGLGVAAAVLRYRVATYRHPAPLADAQRAIRLVRASAAEWNIDPARVGILGFSAGGHVATSAAVIHEPAAADGQDPIDRLSSRPDALIACYPVVTFGRHGHKGSMRNLLGESPGEQLVEQLSLESRVSPATPPSFLWHTADDAGVPVQNSLLLAEALARSGVSFALHVFPHGGHGMGLAGDHPTVRQWTDLCGRWLAEIGFVPDCP